MKKIILSLGIVCIALLASSCFVKMHDFGRKKTIVASKIIKNKTIDNIEDFSKVHNTGSIDLVYSIGAPHVELTAPDNIIDSILVTVTNGAIDVRYKSELRVINEKQPIVAHIFSSHLNEVEMYGSADLKVDKLDFAALDDKSISLSVKGSSDINCQGFSNAEKFVCSIKGSGDVKIKELNAKEAAINIKGSADVDARSIKSMSVRASIFGSGDIKLTGDTDYLDLSIFGSGDIDITKMNYKKLEMNNSGSGRIKK